MGRKFIECNVHDTPGEPACMARISADTEKELIELAGRHAINVHGLANTETLRNQLRGLIREA